MDFTFVLTGRDWYAASCPQGGALGYGRHWAFSPLLLVCSSVGVSSYARCFGVAKTE